MQFNKQLRALRKERDLSQEALAEAVGVSRQAVQKWESGHGYPETETLMLLAKTLGVTLDCLMYGAGVEPPTQAAAPGGEIRILSQDGKSIVNCRKVTSSPVFKTGEDEPKYALFGVSGTSFWGEDSTLLGWYADEEALSKEVEAILAALDRGAPSYELRHAARVKEGVLSIKLEK